MCDSWIDSVLGYVTLDPKIIIPSCVLRQRTPLDFHFMGGLPCTHDHLPDAAHRLRVTAYHAEYAEIVQDVFGGNGFWADTTLGKGDIFRNTCIQVVAYHEHIEMFGNRVDSIGAGWIGRGRQNVGIPCDTNNIGCVTA